MADPSIVNTWRALAIFQGKSGLPEDRYINTFGFSSPGVLSHQAAHDLIAADLSDFYTAPPVGQTATVAGMLSATAIDAAAGLEVRTYMLTDPVPREALSTVVPLSGLSAATAYPNEVALVLSFYSGRNLPRQRGRIYIGPLTTLAGSPDGASGDVLPTADVRLTLVRSAQRMMARTDIEWSVISPTSLTSPIITAGWVDNRFDTQRRRGTKPTTRTTFPTA